MSAAGSGSTVQRKNRIFPVLLVLCGAWMVVIFLFSAQMGDQSGALSGKLLKSLLAFFVPKWSNMTAAEQSALIDRLHLLFRKLGHFSEYAVLGVLLALIFRFLPEREAGGKQTYAKKSRQKVSRGKFSAKTILLPALLSFLYACSDELHQRFVAGRSGQFRDVLIDFSGACCGILLILLTTRKMRSEK